MHICFLTAEFPKIGYPHGGVGTFIRNLGVELVKKGVRVSVLGANYNDQPEYDVYEGVHVYRTRTFNKYKGMVWFSRALAANKRLKEIHAEYPIDIVESTEVGLAFINKIEGIKYLIRMNGGHHFFATATKSKINPWTSYQEKQSFKKADHVISVSKFTAETTRSLLGLGNLPISIIPNPIDTSLFKPSGPNSVTPNKLLFVGTICEKKGIRQLIMALPKIKKEFPDVTLEVVGRDSEMINRKSYTEYLQTFIDDKVHDKVIFSGPVDLLNIPLKIASAEVCVYPSHMEALPLAWLEVMASAKPFVGSMQGPGPEVIEHGVTGRLANSHDPDSIAAEVIAILADKKAALKMGELAREDVLKRFDVKVLADVNIDYYKSIVI
jgi:glycosyltransferase involved in cell wall biosynthesis